MSWREKVLQAFTPEIARLTLVADPDGLLLEEGILQGIQERGFELIPFEDPIAFRYAYESKYRSHWDRGEDTELVVVLRSGMQDLNSLPYDLVQAGRKLSFNLGDLFPDLSYPVVDALDRGDLDVLYRAQHLHNPGKLGDNATKDFVLRHAFEIAPELINKASDLLRVLLRRHYRGQRIPKILNDRFIQVLRQKDLFNDWPLETIVQDREAFFAFLQERWPIFLEHLVLTGGTGVREPIANYGLKFPGPSDLPFDHDDVRIYIDNLFLEGILKPISYEKADALSGKWVSVGVVTSPEADRSRRLAGLIETVKTSIPAADARHLDWLAFAHRWAEMNMLWWETATTAPGGTLGELSQIQQRVDIVFAEWVQKRYSGLHNQPATPPVMLHHVPRALARHLEQHPDAKIALVVVDGLAFDQWVVLRDVVARQQPKFRFREEAVFAWLPTLTAVSRQAAFAGKIPLYFPSTIHTTNREAALWSQFWADHGVPDQDIAYLKGLGDGDPESITDHLNLSRIRVAGFVVDKVDRIMHGMELGTAGMHNQVRQWAMQGFMAKFLNLLCREGFTVYLTSDHGNVEAKGCGCPSEGAIAEVRGERVRVYSDARLRDRVKQSFPNAIEWLPVGLPENYLPLLADGRYAFIREGEKIVGHGSFCIEELVVPFVQVENWIS